MTEAGIRDGSDKWPVMAGGGGVHATLRRHGLALACAAVAVLSGCTTLGPD
jgi:hypothetical protein